MRLQEDKQKWLKGLGDERAEWIRQLPFSLSSPAHKLVVVHAGLIPGIPLKQQSLKTLTEVKPPLWLSYFEVQSLQICFMGPYTSLFQGICPSSTHYS